MKNICIVTTSTAFPGEKGLNRMFFLARILVRNGFNVDFLTSDFQHWDKKPRELEKQTVIEGVNVFLFHEIGYKKNISVKRIISHYKLSKQIEKFLKDNKKYDLYYVDIPDNHISAMVSKIAKANKKPFIVDVEDLWPEAMKMVLNIPVITSIPYSYFKKDAKITYKNANAIIGSSDTYRDECDKYNIDVPIRQTVYVGNELKVFDQGVSLYFDGINKNEGEFWITYAGTLGASYDIATLIKSAQLLYLKYPNIHFYILGDGPCKNSLVELSTQKPCNVNFMGYMKYQMMAAYLSRSDITVNSIIKSAPQSIVSKIADYLAAGIPLINTGSDREFRNKVVTDQIGVNVEAEDENLLAEVIEKLYKDTALRKQMGENARRIAEEQFDREESFLRIVDIINKLLASDVKND